MRFCSESILIHNSLESAEKIQLLNLLICPRSKQRLKHIGVGNDEALLCPSSGVLYPIVDDIVIMNPVTKEVKNLCAMFLEKHSNLLSSLHNNFNIEATKMALSLDSKLGDNKWSQEEMTYWERRFESQLNNLNQKPSGWNRTLPRKRLLDLLPISLNNKIILEIGCGGAGTLFDVYGDTLTMYIGLDLSFNACKLARKLFPKGIFIQGPAETLPLKNNSVDVIVAYGVLHHLPRHEEHLNNILPVIKEKGYFLGSDPVMKPRIHRPRIFCKDKNALTPSVQDGIPATGMSPHNEWINWENLLNVINDNARLIDACFEYSPLRHLLIMFVCERFNIRSKFFVKFVLALDRLWLGTIGKLHRSLGPAGVIYTLQRLASRNIYNA